MGARFTYILLMLLALAVVLASCKRDNRGLVVGKVQAVSKLATTEFTVDKLIFGTKTKHIAWVIKLNETRFLAYSQAKIKTGIDLNKLSKHDIQINDKSIELRLPAVEVINLSYPADKFRMDYDISDIKKVMNKFTVYDQERLFREAEMDIRNSLKYMGLVETTQDKTRALLTGLLTGLGFNEIYISFDSNDLVVEEVLAEQNKKEDQ